MANITIVGAGYVGTSLSVLLAQKFSVVTLDIDKKKVDQINNQLSPIDDEDINFFLKEKELNIQATCDKKIAYRNANLWLLQHRLTMMKELIDLTQSL